ncbi:hypothetical protein GMORB2_7012 [Geosmithia morbida]|uniref:Methyltransferase domain-containing protein n=1 Tax=Geosmithia morbida TaxID=1094350 RepID=A0A9P5D4E2_9HYPO|nr:uncharacterized protein GMORB2_7012 [Geosmithia morbida]KAF4122705.1 hypothetical protein GMORB2_7012 [Geosmithia morbida]
MGQQLQESLETVYDGSPGARRQDASLLQVQKWSYLEDVPTGIDPLRQLLQGYSHLPAEEVDRHLLRIRDEAWKLCRLPYIGRWRFLNLVSSGDPCYQQALFRLRLPGSKDALLDLGCALGQTLRQFCADGVKGRRLFGVDLSPELVDLGYDMFRDRQSLGATFVVGDALDPDDTRLARLEGQITMVHADSFFHLFTWTQQLYIAKRIVGFLKPGTKNAMVFGTQAGTLVSEPRDRSSVPSPSSPYLHDQESFQQLWDTVGAMTNTAWAVHVENGGTILPLMPGVEKGTIPIKFAAYQVPVRDNY